MALEEIKNAFEGFPCGSLYAPGGVREFSSWSSKSKSELLKGFSNEGVDTIILLRIEELTPYFLILFKNFAHKLASDNCVQRNSGSNR